MDQKDTLHNVFFCARRIQVWKDTRTEVQQLRPGHQWWPLRWIRSVPRLLHSGIVLKHTLLSDVTHSHLTTPAHAQLTLSRHWSKHVIVVNLNGKVFDNYRPDHYFISLVFQWNIKAYHKWFLFRSVLTLWLSPSFFSSAAFRLWWEIKHVCVCVMNVCVLSACITAVCVPACEQRVHLLHQSSAASAAPVGLVLGCGCRGFLRLRTDITATRWLSDSHAFASFI